MNASQIISEISRCRPTLWPHLLDRIHQRQITAPQLGLLAHWLDCEPEVPPAVGSNDSPA